MRLVKKSISLPEDLYKFAERQSAELARERGSSENVSAYIRELLARQKRLKENGQVAEAA